ncbi:MAG: Cytoplasmic membrane protein FsxA [uncultured Pseudonocardia sp.]|uniref:Cytoplasmic membrane protein FsxA n=1 Tax=uncultured Pseudonocardia sp. TaxID=211455 RepID=A0A6J4Q1W9_9PSEU|nr:MAG: Cytoplasmic membrane protein FsxA [uncultured Pseudonocardia sp.]
MSQRPAHALAALLLTAAVGHAARPGFFDAMVPRRLPGRARTWTYASGLAEAAVGVAVAAPRTRRLGGFAAAALFLAVFPANVKMARDAANAPAAVRAAVYGRLPLQVPLVVWAVRVARAARG